MINEEDTFRQIKGIFRNCGEVMNFRFDWEESKYFKFQVYMMDEFAIEMLWRFFGDMIIVVTTEEEDTTLNIRIKEKLSL